MNSYIDESTEMGKLARRYLDLLLNGDRRGASQLIMAQVRAKTQIQRIYLDVFQVCQYEIGLLWQENLVTVAHEHFCTAATQMIMSQLYPYILTTERCGKTLIASCVSGDLHEIGIRMVCDFFEMAGWDTYYLGANTPATALIASAIERNSDLLAISTTMPDHVAKVRDLIRAVRRDSGCTQVEIMVGGLPFTQNPDLWQSVGADGCANDAASAVDLGNALLDDRQRSEVHDAIPATGPRLTRR